MLNEEHRCEILGRYIAEEHVTVRACAERFGISKSTVHKDVKERLRGVNRALWISASKVLAENKAERHIRGGEATRRKYLDMHAADEK